MSIGNQQRQSLPAAPFYFYYSQTKKPEQLTGVWKFQNISLLIGWLLTKPFVFSNYTVQSSPVHDDVG
jgi:hypothetical protein